MEFAYGIDPSNPDWSQERDQAQRRSMWASYRWFLQKADRFALHYWPPSPDVQPFLDRGMQPELSDVSPQARQITGELTAELRDLVGTSLWFRVDLFRQGERVYIVEDHEDTAMWNCTQAELSELVAAGVELSVVMDLTEQRRRYEALQPAYRGLEWLAMAVAGAVKPGTNGYGYGSTGDLPAAGERTAYRMHVEGGEVWVEVQAAALAAIESLETAQKLVAAVQPPIKPGEYLELSLAVGLLRQSRLRGPRDRAFTHALPAPTPGEWEDAVRTVGPRASHFAASVEDADLAPYATNVGFTDVPPHGGLQLGLLSPDVLSVIARGGPRRVQLLSGTNVLLEFRSLPWVNRLDLMLLPYEARRLDQPPGRLVTLGPASQGV